MKIRNNYQITREKHLDHMVKVVPFIVLCYAVQCYVIFSASPTEFSTVSLSILGGVLASMIAGFITYDLKHKVTFQNDTLTISFWGRDEVIRYTDIWEIEVSEPGQSFATLSLKAGSKKHSFYFIDNADKIKTWLEEKQHADLKAA